MQPRSTTEGTHLVLYDGVCGLCSRLVQFLLAHDRVGAFRFASLQSATGRTMVERSGGNPDDLTSLYVFADYRTPKVAVFARSRAALFVFGEIGWPWKLARLVGVLPTPLLDRAYSLIARNRYRLFGRADRCLMPSRDYQSRFVD